MHQRNINAKKPITNFSKHQKKYKSRQAKNVFKNLREWPYLWKEQNCGDSKRSVVARDWGERGVNRQNTGFLGQ